MEYYKSEAYGQVCKSAFGIDLKQRGMLSDMQIETFYDSLKKTISDLHMLLKDERSELIVFWSELPFFEPERKEPEYTQLGICLREFGYTYHTVDLTGNEVAFWTDYLHALNNYQQDFFNEGNAELLSASIQEAEFFVERAKCGKLYRNMYIIKNNKGSVIDIKG